MAGVHLQISDNRAAVLQPLRNVVELFGDLTPIFRDFGEHLLISHRQRFADQVAPDGTPWAPLSPAYQAIKPRNKNRILTLDGYLQRMHYDASATTLLFGSDRVYAAAQHFGAPRGTFGKTRHGAPIPWGDIPARPVVGISDSDVQALGEIANDHVDRAAAGGGA